MKQQVDSIYKETYDGAFIRSKTIFLSNNESPSSNFLKAEVFHNKRNIIRGVKDSNNLLTKNSSETLEACRSYYEKLYSLDETNERIANYFTEDLPQVPFDRKEKCEESISFEELKNQPCQ